MVTREDWEAGTPVAVTSDEVPGVVAAYERAARYAVLVREVFAEFGLPHSERDVCPTVDRSGMPRVLVSWQSAAHRRACENVLALLSDPPTRSRRRARRCDRHRPGRATPPATA